MPRRHADMPLRVPPCGCGCAARWTASSTTLFSLEPLKRVSVLPSGGVIVFRVTHITDYRYAEPVAEAYLELRLTPPNREMQTVREHRLLIEPISRTSGYRDFFGNEASFLSLPYRHTRLTIRSEALVQTLVAALPLENL